MNIVIIGRGAIGSLWLYHLSKVSSINVSVIDRKGTTSQSSCFTHYNGLSHQYSYLLANEHELKNADVLLVCLKSFACAQAVNNIAKSLNSTADIILNHNGMGVIEDLNESVVNQHNIYTMLTTHGCYKATRNHVVHTGIGHCDIGLSIGNNKTAKPNWLTLLNQALPKVNWQENISEKQWHKLAINCVINPLTAIHKVKNGEISTQRFAKEVKAIASEVSIAAQSQGITLTADFIEQQALLVAKKTAKNTSSMLADVLAGKPTEVESINGYICKLASDGGFNTPTNLQLLEKIRRHN